MSRNSSDFPRAHDTIFFYVKSIGQNVFNEIKIQRDKPVKQSKRVWQDKKNMRARDENGNIIYEMSYETKANDVWDIPYIASTDKQRVDYATQKPKALIERIIKASSNEGDLVADFYIGSGTTAEVCKDLNRNFVGCDINPRAVELSKKRCALSF